MIYEESTGRKRCTHCNNVVDATLDNFTSWPAGRDGLSGWCKKCQQEGRERRKNREDKLERHRLRAVSWSATMVAQSRTNARNKNLEFNLDEEFVKNLWDKQNGRCYWLGIKLHNNGMVRDIFRPSPDRKDSSKGYTKDNVVLSSLGANLTKSVSTEERFEEYLTAVGESIFTAKIARQR